MIHLLLLLCFLISPLVSLAADTISGNQTLTGDQTLVSSGGNFKLGFLTPGNSSRHYIGIWYRKVQRQTIVWVANRETPVSDRNSSHLRVLDGNLVLLNESQSQIWSTTLTPSNSNNSSVVAVLLDDGNLVLRDGLGSNSSQYLWESFDNPADTWLPGGRLGYDKIRQRKQLMTSWKNSEDPAPGLFSFELDPSESQYIIKWNRTQLYWTSGPWNGRLFSAVPEMRLNYIYNFSYVNNTNESYFAYSLYNSSIISRSVMDISGQVKMLSWDNVDWNLFWSRPRQQCEVYAFCGAFGTCNQNSKPFCNCLPGFRVRSENDWNLTDYSGGCVREMDLQCESNNTVSSGQRRDRFLPIPYMSISGNNQSLAAGSIRECESACLNNCSCTAYVYDGNSCSLWGGELFNLQQLSKGDGNARSIYIRLSGSSPLFSSSKENKGVI